DRLLLDPRILDCAREVAIDPDPLHLAAVQHLALAHDRDVVLRLTGDDTGVAAMTRAEIDGEPPGVLAARPARVERRRLTDVGGAHGPPRLHVLAELGSAGAG